jgi:hypothetical protein
LQYKEYVNESPGNFLIPVFPPDGKELLITRLQGNSKKKEAGPAHSDNEINWFNAPVAGPAA